MQAPVETPEKRASVSRATCRPNGTCLSADVSWYVSSMPVPAGPQPISAITSPACTTPVLMASIAVCSSVNTRAGPVNR